MNRQLLTMEPSPTLALNQKAKAMKSAGQTVFNFTAGEPDGQTPQNIRQAAIDAIGSGKNRYTEGAGIAPLRKAITEKATRVYQKQYTPNEVIVSTGGKQAIFNALYALLNPEDEVMILTPAWVSYKAMLTMLGVKITEVHAGIDQKFVPSISQIEQAITDKTKLIILNSPCNPSGAVYTQTFLDELEKLLQKHAQVYVLTDDIYEHFVFEGSFCSFGMAKSFPKERLIIANGVSKSHAMTGWRIGYALADQKLIGVMNKIQSQVTSNACSIAQYAALEAIESEAVQENPFKSSFLKRRNLIFEALSEIEGLDVLLPSGAFYIFPKVERFLGGRVHQKTLQTDVDLATYLLDEYGVAVVPGTAFQSPGYLRLSYGISETQIQEGVKTMAKALSMIEGVST